MSDRHIEMTPERVKRMFEIADVGVVFLDPDRQRYLAAMVLARAVTDDSVWELVQRAAVAPLPDEPSTKEGE
jgi:hypothetical protein